MGDLEQPIRRVWRRLRLQRFLGFFVASLTIALVLVAIVLVLERLGKVAIPGPDWALFAAAAGLSAMAAAAGALTSGAGRLDAAVALDHAFGLQERFSSALVLSEAVRETPAGRALLADATRHAAGLDIASKFRVNTPRLVWMPLIPAVIAVGLLFLPSTWLSGLAQGSTPPPKPEDSKNIAEQAKMLGSSIAETRKRLERGEFDETEELLAEVQKYADKMAQSPPASKDEALAGLNQLTDALKNRQKELGGAEQIAQKLKQLQNVANNGPGDEFARGMAKGDFAKAAEQLQKLREQLASGGLSDVQKEALRQQLAQMAQELQGLSDLKERQKQLEEARKSGQLTEEQYREQLAKLNQDAQRLAQLQKMADQLAKAQQALQGGDLNGAANAMGMTQEQLQQMAMDMQELEMLDGALVDLLDTKAGLCEGGSNQIGDFGGFNSLGEARYGPGQGMGRGRGAGDRPEAPDDVAGFDTRTPQQLQKGSAVVTGFAPPRGLTPGQSIESVEGEIENSAASVAEAMSNQKVPAKVKKHILGYFDRVRQGQ